MSYHIGLVEEHKHLNQLFTFYLNNEGWKVTAFEKEDEARSSMPERLDLWIVDITLPILDKYSLFCEGKARKIDIPIIFISDHDLILEQIEALHIGGVSCMEKPFLPRDLVTRIRSLQESSM
jgi:two-component system, OmpR family, response regulator CssR